MSIDALGVCLNEHLLAVRTQNVAIEILDGEVIRCVFVKEDSRLLACLERILHYAVAVVAYLSITLTVGHGSDIAKILWRISAIGDVSQFKRLLGNNAYSRKNCRNKEEKKSFHRRLIV